MCCKYLSLYMSHSPGTCAGFVLYTHVSMLYTPGTCAVCVLYTHVSMSRTPGTCAGCVLYSVHPCLYVVYPWDMYRLCDVHNKYPKLCTYMSLCRIPLGHVQAVCCTHMSLCRIPLRFVQALNYMHGM